MTSITECQESMLSLTTERVEHLITSARRHLFELIQSQKNRCDKKLLAHIPTKPGVYRLSGRKSHEDLTVYVGEAGDLRRRIRDHLSGPARKSTLLRKLIREGVRDVASAKAFVSTCECQFVVIEDRRERRLFEALTIAVLEPRYND